MYRRTRAMLALATCTAGLALLPASALADTTDDPVVDVESPIQADEGTVLAETLHPDVTPAGEATCAAPELSTPLTAFKDRRDYFVAPGGDFENPALPGWQLSGGATVTGGNSTHAVLGDGHGASLLLPPGSTATSPEMCVDLNYPTFRFFATQLTEDADAELAVDVIYPALTRNNVREAKRFKLKAKDGWRLSDDIKLEPQRLGKQAGWRKVAIRVRVKPGKNPGSYRVDDLLIDPRRFN